MFKTKRKKSFERVIIGRVVGAFLLLSFGFLFYDVVDALKSDSWTPYKLSNAISDLGIPINIEIDLIESLPMFVVFFFIAIFFILFI